jgi:hypothetical protein
VYKHAEDGGFEPAAVSGASYYPLPDSLIFDAGPGLFTTDLVIQEGSQHATSEDYTIIGETKVWNTREEICLSIDTDETWDLSQVNIYLGFEDFPASSDGTPIIGEFPYKESFKKPVDTYDLVLNLEEEFEFTWGKWDRENRIWHIVVFAKVVEEDQEERGKAVHEEACAVGLNSFDNRWGWHSNYLLEHPETGHFVDAPVGGVDFDTSSHKGKTDVQGAFDYIPGENVTLSIGDLELGTVAAGHKITPLDLLDAESTSDIRTINMARVLQSLDEDQDPVQGISIPDGAVESLNEVMEDMGIVSVDFEDSATVDELINRTVAKANDEKNLDLKVVSMDEAKGNLDKGLQSNVFRKNISKTPELLTTKAKLEFMPVYVPARRANGDYITLEYIREDDSDTLDVDESYTEERAYVTPLVVTYTDEDEETGADDVFAAVSRDDGSTWKITNVSRSAGRSSFTLQDGTKYYGDVNKPQCKVRGNYILIGWTSKFARSGKPAYSIKPDDDYIYDDPYYVEDIFGVGGPQRSVDYAKQDHPELGEVPYSAVWTCRGIVDPETGDVKWFKPERLTSGRRDACQLMFNGNPGTGYGIVWQEDPEGLRPGKEAGPGEGGSGATTNHKTDIWYSYISWADFAKVDENFVSGGEPEHDDELVAGRDKALVPCSLPIRLSDNDVVNFANIKLELDEEGNYIPALTDDSQTGSGQSDEGDAEEPVEEEEELVEEDPDYAGTHMYGYLVPGVIFEEGMFTEDGNGYFVIEEVIAYINSSEFRKEDYFYPKINNQLAEKDVAITVDGDLLDGNTGASRPNIMMQPYTKKDGTKSAWVVVVYEETKGMGSGPPEGTGGSDDSGTDSDGTDETEGGSGAGVDKYFPDQGKNVIYHSFDLYTPNEVSGGHIMNPQQVEYPLILNPDVLGAEYIPDYTADPILCWLEDEDGHYLDEMGSIYADEDETHYYEEGQVKAYENARRPRLIIQSKKAALAGKSGEEEGTVMVVVFKMGDLGQGQPSDIMMTQFKASLDDTGNPYGWDKIRRVSDEVDSEIYYQNISSVTVDERVESKGDPDNEKRDHLKVIEWHQTEENISDPTAMNPYDDARAHRGIIRGDFLSIAYTWTPNWAASRNGNDHYDLFIRRSFNGGDNWTTDPKGNTIEYETISSRIAPEEEKELFEERLLPVVIAAGDFEPSRNVSMLRNNKMSIIEPRLVGTPPNTYTDNESIPDADNSQYVKKDGVIHRLLYPEDERNTAAYWVTYGTISYPGRNSEEVQEPLDLYYASTFDKGQSYSVVEKIYNPERESENPVPEEPVFVWDWLAKDTGKNVAAQAECQIRMKPDGVTFWSVWNETGVDGSDVKFRKLNTDDIYGFGAEILIADILPPVITISGVSDGDITNEDVSLSISLDEAGTFTGSLEKNGIPEETLTLSNVPYPITAAASTDVYILVVEAVDADGNTSIKTITFTVDNRLPEITITGVTNGETTTETRTPVITATGDDTQITLLRNGILDAGFASGTPLSEDGRYELKVVSTDTLSTLSATKAVEWVIDLEDPTVKISSVRDGEIYYKKVTPSINISDNHSSNSEMDIVTTLGKDGALGVDFISGSTISETGSYVLYAKATDLAGNWAEDTVNFIIEEPITTTPDPDDSTSNEKGNKKDEVEEPVVEGDIPFNTFEVDDALTIHVPQGLSDNDPEIAIVPEEELEVPDNAIMVNGEVYEITLTDADGNLIETFDDPITFTYVVDDFTAGNMKALKDLKISYWDEDNLAWIAMPTTFDAESKTLTATTEHLSRFSVMSFPDFPEFEDMKGHQLESLIYRMASLGIIDGDDLGNFNPYDLVSREEMIKLLVTASGDEPDESTTMFFKDQENVSEWARGYIFKAINDGFVVGYEDQTIRAENNITGSEGASMVANLCRRNGITLQHGNPTEGGHGKGWATQFIDELTTIGAIGAKFDHGCYMRREDVVEMIMKAIDSENK